MALSGVIGVYMSGLPGLMLKLEMSLHGFVRCHRRLHVRASRAYAKT